MHNLKLRWILSASVFLMLGLQPATGQVFFLRDTFCTNQVFIINGHLYGPDNPTGTEVIPGGAAGGADSIIEVRLVFFKPSTTLIKQVICGADTLWVNNVPYHAGYTIGDETIEGGAANGCDSIIQVRLTKAPVPHTIIADTLCPEEFIQVNGVRYDRDKPAGMEILFGASSKGCDSIVSIALHFPNLLINLGDDLEITIGDTVCLTPALNFQAESLDWSPTLPCVMADCFPVCAPFYSSTYVELAATHASGCIVKDGILINVNKLVQIYAPTVFNPDAAWPNNRFYLSAAAGISSFKTFRIANRWGELVWEQGQVSPDTPEDGWDGSWKGKMAPPGVYVFWAEYVLGDGTRDVVSGSFALLR